MLQERPSPSCARMLSTQKIFQFAVTKHRQPVVSSARHISGQISTPDTIIFGTISLMASKIASSFPLFFSGNHDPVPRFFRNFSTVPYKTNGV